MANYEKLQRLRDGARERTRTVVKTVAQAVRHGTSGVRDFAVQEKYPIAAAGCASLTAGLVATRTGGELSPVTSTLAGIALGLDFKERKKRRRQTREGEGDSEREAVAFDVGVRTGLMLGRMAEDIFGAGGGESGFMDRTGGIIFMRDRSNFPIGRIEIQDQRMDATDSQPEVRRASSDGTPIYESYNHETVITDPDELLLRIGNPYQAALRIGVRLARYHQGEPLTEGHVEYFRMALAGLEQEPEFRETLCNTGIEIVEDMQHAVADYERQFRPQDRYPRSAEE